MESDLKKQFLQIIQSNQGILNSICKVYYDTVEDQKDARQEIILQLWKSFPHFRNESKVSTWLYKVALNTILSQLRKTNKEPIKTPLVDQQIPISTYLDDEFQQLQQAISMLKAEDKALVLLYLEGYQHQEIATTLDLTTTNVSTRLNRIKKRLKVLFRSEYRAAAPSISAQKERQLIMGIKKST